jgi:predicted lipoprotein
MKYNLVFLFAAFLLGITSCKKSKEQEFDREAMLENMASSHIIPEYQNLKTELSELTTAVSSFQESATSGNLTNMQDQFLTTYLNFERVKMFDFGPAETINLKAGMNTYPVDGDKIDANIIAGSYTLASAANTDAIGFPAIDYLIYSGDGSAILDRFTTDINATNAHTYLQTVVTKMSEELTTVLDQWNGSYKSTFVAASGTDVGSSISLMYNEFVKDIELLKNAKIGIPAGQFSGGETFPTYVEAFYSGKSQLLALENLTALKRVYTGGSGVGFDDYMVFALENGSTSVASSTIESQFDVCHSHISGLGDPFSDAIPTNFDGFSAAFQQIKKLVAYAKTDIPGALGILITFSDTDGD